MDLKALQTALQQLETEKGVSKDKIIKTIEDALSAAYKKITAKKPDSPRQIQSGKRRNVVCSSQICG